MLAHFWGPQDRNTPHKTVFVREDKNNFTLRANEQNFTAVRQLHFCPQGKNFTKKSHPAKETPHKTTSGEVANRQSIYRDDILRGPRETTPQKVFGKYYVQTKVRCEKHFCGDPMEDTPKMLAHFWGPQERKTPLKCLLIFGEPNNERAPIRIGALSCLRGDYK